ncbi:hypothetical protein B0O99DRAFT_610311 [Bisporella sp. PMI_857]|nr:hypothetical protein B0O99DRAFT_612895 [Bisporella sp. PMI_857]KAH8600267.1 hypothetical protein B0O99DRAFT_610311 [Bisporella sp. PMI_857]
MSDIQGSQPQIHLQKKPSHPFTLQSWLPLYLKKADRSTDTVLMVLCYTSLLTSSVLSRISIARIHAAAQRIIKSASTLPPNTTILISTSEIPPSRLLITATRLKAYHPWGISYAQVAVNAAFQTLENGAYLSSKGVLGWSAEKQNKAWLWSCRFWIAHVVLDFMRLGREYATREVKGKGKGSGEPVGKEYSEWLSRWKREAIVNGAWLPLTVHWSLEKGLLTDFGVGVFGSIAGLSGLKELLKKVN